MERKLFFFLLFSMSCVVLADENNNFWDFDTSYVNPVTNSASVIAQTEVSTVTERSTWAYVTEAFSTFVNGIKVVFR